MPSAGKVWTQPRLYSSVVQAGEASDERLQIGFPYLLKALKLIKIQQMNFLTFLIILRIISQKIDVTEKHIYVKSYVGIVLETEHLLLAVTILT